MNTDKIYAVIVAAGRGTRFGRPYNKVFHQIDGETVLSRCLRALARSNIFDGIYCVIARDDENLFRQTLQTENTASLVHGIAYGGDTRTASVLNGLDALPEDARIVAIHDAARCFVPESVVRACVESALKWGSGVPATSVTDTVKEIAGDLAIRTLNRDKLRCVQTPQTFRLAELKAAYEEFDGVATDDASVYEAKYGGVRLVCLPECAENIKITLPSDGERKEHAMRIGMGYDAHRLVEGRKLILCGVEFPYEKGLLGHSDADVATHALMDALLGAAGLGDIGKLFPDSDPAYKGVSSLKLLEHVMSLLRSRGYKLCSCDITIVAQRPKMMHKRDEMIRMLAQTMQVDAGLISVKATTTEGMGFEGEGLGISASAVALLG